MATSPKSNLGHVSETRVQSPQDHPYSPLISMTVVLHLSYLRFHLPFHPKVFQDESSYHGLNDIWDVIRMANLKALICIPPRYLRDCTLPQDESVPVLYMYKTYGLPRFVQRWRTKLLKRRENVVHIVNELPITAKFIRAIFKWL